MCPAATPDEFGDASWANAGVATITTKVSVSRSCFFMSVLYQPPLKNAIRKARTIFGSISYVTQRSVCVRHSTTSPYALLETNEIAYVIQLGAIRSYLTDALPGSIALSRATAVPFCVTWDDALTRVLG